uniref:Protein FAR1-RELATED SEQUENCE n=1 Tax=Fagus sylvatica TaxID=28930 RepID=A0A2N9H879_FAGSY
MTGSSSPLNPKFLPSEPAESEPYPWLDGLPQDLLNETEFSSLDFSFLASTSNPPEPPQSFNGKNVESAKEIMDHSGYNIHSLSSESDGEEIVSSESNGFETISESIVSMNDGNREFKSHVPEIGMSFSCEQEAHKFYQKYATKMGFKVRKGKVQRLSNGSLRKRYFFCSQEGFRSKKQPTKKTTYTRKETRTGCNAKIQITFENERCLISEFISDHNHDLQGSTQRHYIDLNSKTSEVDSLIQPIHEIGTTKETEAGFCDMNYSKHLRDKQMNSLQPEDAQGLIDCLKQLQVEDPSLFYTLQVDAESHMTNFFWRDSRSKIDYDYFGDVLILDTTFRMDRYNMICAPFLGVNHHQQPVLFGCAFLLDETMETYTWLLGTFMGAMGRRQPKTILTTECEAILTAVKATLPKIEHRLFKPHVCQNAKQLLSMYYGQLGFESLFLFDSKENQKSEAMTLPEYVQKYEKAAEQQRREELHEDFRCNASILCVHALKVLNTKNIFQIPSQYVLKRWTKYAKDGVVEDDNCEEIGDKNDSSLSSSKRKLMHKALNFITKSVAVEKSRKIAERYLGYCVKGG